MNIRPDSARFPTTGLGKIPWESYKVRFANFSIRPLESLLRMNSGSQSLLCTLKWREFCRRSFFLVAPSSECKTLESASEQHARVRLKIKKSYWLWVRSEAKWGASICAERDVARFFQIQKVKIGHYGLRGFFKLEHFSNPESKFWKWNARVITSRADGGAPFCLWSYSQPVEQLNQYL